ncbi:hypothetical protein EYF80_046261 [Liparis tanakae]|uniref:Uncharacterized protein n=1 Tax=Liparis tanakae TaxID=230148 RepID=A0A4Z2FQW3_9TELE|nr:hypothetical protein EYF80_046261 [Liparis tanakae]
MSSDKDCHSSTLSPYRSFMGTAGLSWADYQLRPIRHRSLNHTPAPPTLHPSMNTPCCHKCIF